MIKVYTDQSFILPENRKVIFPLLFDLCYFKLSSAQEKFELVNCVEECDVIIIPLQINTYFFQNKENILKEFITKFSIYKKPIWAYSGGDRGISYGQTITIFRLGGLKSRLSQNNHILPCFVNDAYVTVLKKDFFVLDKKEMPTIGFVGNANVSIKEFIKELTINLFYNFQFNWNKKEGDKQPFYPSSSIRYRILKKTENNKKIETNFIFRHKYRAGAKTKVELEKTNFEFFTNISNNIYTFCMRGAGNFSVRFYETLIMGRIPILLETDNQLPLCHFIDWKQHCLFVNEDNLEQKVIEFHNATSNEKLKQIQLNNRNLALQKLNRVSYFFEFANS